MQAAGPAATLVPVYQLNGVTSHDKATLPTYFCLQHNYRFVSALSHTTSDGSGFFIWNKTANRQKRTRAKNEGQLAN
jgi:hypothetical protein